MKKRFELLLFLCFVLLMACGDVIEQAETAVMIEGPAFVTFYTEG